MHSMLFWSGKAGNMTMPKLAKFKDLAVGDEFEFCHTSVIWPGAVGPWVKISARCYKPITTPYSDDPAERYEHAFWSDHHNQVGSINADVIPLPMSSTANEEE